MKNRLLPAMILSSLMFVTCYAFADSAVIAPQDFAAQVLDFIRGFGGLPMVLKIAGVITLIISALKVTALNKLVWAKLGGAKPWLAPALGLVAGILSVSVTGKLTLAGVVAYVFSGGGAVILHELFDSIKAIPGVGKVYVSIIDFIEENLGGPRDEKLQLK